MQAARPSPERLLAVLLLAGSLGMLTGGEAALEALRRLDARGGRRSAGAEICPYRARTGFPCMGCGGTRAFARVTRGRLREGFALNPLGAGAALGTLLLAWGSGAFLLTGRRGWLTASLGLVLVLAPVVFVWNGVSWWLARPAGVFSPR